MASESINNTLVVHLVTDTGGHRRHVLKASTAVEADGKNGLWRKR
jgi:hypothetical protein